MNFVRQVGRADGHKDVTLDTNGDEVLVWTNSNDPQPICNNGIVKIRLSDGQQTCLATFDWSLAVHISAPDNAGFVYVETYAPSNPTHNQRLGGIYQRAAAGQTRRFASIAHGTSSQPSIPDQHLQLAAEDVHQPRRQPRGLQQRLRSADDRTDMRRLRRRLPDHGGRLPCTPPPTAPPPSPAAAGAYTCAARPRWSATSKTMRRCRPRGPGTRIAVDSTAAVPPFWRWTRAARPSSPSPEPAVNWIGYRDPWSGIAQVYVDGVLKGTIDTYSANALAQTVVYSVSGLSNAQPYLTIAATGTKDRKPPAGHGSGWTLSTFLWSRRLRPSTTTPAPHAVTTTTATPIRVQQNASDVVDSAAAHGTRTPRRLAAAGRAFSRWTRMPGPPSRSPARRVKWIGYRDQWSGIARVYVDGVLAATVDTYASPSQGQAVLYTAAGLSSGVHTLAIEVAGSRNAASGGNWVWVDAFDVTP